MRVLCLISHERPGIEPGKFSVYEAGKEYDVDDPEPGLFCSAQEPEEQTVDGIQHTRKDKKGKKQ